MDSTRYCSSQFEDKILFGFFLFFSFFKILFEDKIASDIYESCRKIFLSFFCIFWLSFKAFVENIFKKGLAFGFNFAQPTTSHSTQIWTTMSNLKFF